MGELVVEEENALRHNRIGGVPQGVVREQNFARLDQFLLESVFPDTPLGIRCVGQPDELKLRVEGAVEEVEVPWEGIRSKHSRSNLEKCHCTLNRKK